MANPSQADLSQAGPSHVSSDTRAIDILVRKSIEREPRWPQAMWQWLKNRRPAFSCHWALRVGDEVWQLKKDDDSRNRCEGPTPWASVEHRYTAIKCLGQTNASVDEISQHGEKTWVCMDHMLIFVATDVIQQMKNYDTVLDNCQEFAVKLSDRIPKLPASEEQMEAGRSMFIKGLKDTKDFILATNETDPRSFRDTLKRFKLWIKISVPAIVGGTAAVYFREALGRFVVSLLSIPSGLSGGVMAMLGKVVFSPIGVSIMLCVGCCVTVWLVWRGSGRVLRWWRKSRKSARTRMYVCRWVQRLVPLD
jgi:hypothetical protein